ncbi:unnamed protein product [Lampetra planeri]
MSVPAFIDVTEEDQAVELRQYLRARGAEVSEEASEGGLQQELGTILSALHVIWKDEDKDVESVLNSVISLLLILNVEKQQGLVESLCEQLAKGRDGERPLLRLQLLSNLFHGMGEGPARYVVYCSLVRLAGSCSSIHHIPTELEQVRKWFTEWSLTIDKKQHILRLLYDALVDCKRSERAARVMVELLGSYTEENASQARDDAHRCIVRALRDPNTFLFDHLLALKPVRFLEGELIHDLLTIFVSGKLSAYLKFYGANKDFVESLELHFAASFPIVTSRLETPTPRRGRRCGEGCSRSLSVASDESRARDRGPGSSIIRDVGSSQGGVRYLHRSPR